ncbi:hypothetical protein IW261DRAFT_1557314 [Armillaria novae-zelandiae]|uniref:Zn(2)-C6 fungal-type domain-containing protein n=1 Tax=Armillaria novae-zelandiae TaxID=153914 RepID=A0AA39PRQ7_9AGAR|nr:hypothetical protein IW261DRAFT_1557314 [Armillaria novae-zelandiae]
MGPLEGPSKKRKHKSAEGRGEFHGKDKCGRCQANGARCVMSLTMRSCKRCRIRKPKCMWMDETAPMVMEQVLDLLQDLHARFDEMEGRMENIERELEAVGGHVNDLVDNFEEGSALEYPQDFILMASTEDWELSLRELQDLKGATPEVLWQAMRLRLDQDVAQVFHAHITSMDFNGQDPFELANIKFWHRSHGEGALEHLIVTQAEFYRLGGHRSEWRLWKEYLKGGEDFLVEDSEGELEDGEEVRPEMLPESLAAGVPGMVEWMKRVKGKGKGKVVESGEASRSVDAASLYIIFYRYL